MQLHFLCLNVTCQRFSVSHLGHNCNFDFISIQDVFYIIEDVDNCCNCESNDENLELIRFTHFAVFLSDNFTGICSFYKIYQHRLHHHQASKYILPFEHFFMFKSQRKYSHICTK